jgi:DnaK suppressor protein
MYAAVKQGETNENDSTFKSEDSRSRFLKNLMLKKEELQKVLSQLMDDQNEYKGLSSADDFIEDLDRAEREISAQKYYSLIQRKNKELTKIGDLIDKALEDKEFGLCEECGERIPEERLLVVPEATRCVPCQEELEELDSKRSFLERSYSSVGVKKGFQWQDTESFDDKEELTIKPDLDDKSFADMEGNDAEEDF